MKKSVTVFILLLALVMNAQNQRFIYEYKYILDSTAKNKPETEMLLLDIAPKGSKFYSKDSFETDSLMAATMEKQLKAESSEIDFSKIKSKGKVYYSVEKMYPDYSVIFFNNLAADEYMVQDSREQDWKILSDKQKVGGFIAQKALCDFAGRKWTAWFTTDLPIQDGPYKFYGLPGLIVEIEDSKKQYTFELVSYKTFSEKPKMWISKKRVKGKTVKKSEFYKAFKNFHENFVSEIAKGGFSFDSGTERQIKDRIKKKNNPIELAP